MFPSFDSHPEDLPPQPWKNFVKVRKSLLNFYDDEWWGVNDADKNEMKTLLRQWGVRPEVTCPKPPAWPDFELVMPKMQSRPPQITMTRRPPPLIPAPYHPFAKPKSARRRGGARGRGGARRGRGGVRGGRGVAGSRPPGERFEA